MLAEADRLGIAFIPWFPFGHGSLLKGGSPLEPVANRLEVSIAQLILAWLLHLSPVVVPIPGSTAPAHIGQNVGALDIELSADDLFEIDQIGLRLQAAEPPPTYTL